MWKFAVLSLALATVLSSVQGNGLGVSSWNRMLALLMQTNNAETGTCDKMCYLIFDEEDIVMEYGETYVHKDEPCLVYTCEESGVKQQNIKDQCQEDVTCDNGLPPVRFPVDCCQTCTGGSETTEFEFGDWGEWTECSTTCGEGRRARVRTCPIDAPLGSVDCTGVLQEIETCNTSVPCPVDCVWLEWSQWSTCSVSCGEGMQERTRGQIPAQHGGKPCVGDSVETTPCSNGPCPIIDCVWLEWSEWSTCSVSCGEGMQERTRGQIPPENGGKPCVGDSVETTPCSNGPCPIPCVWLEWSQWSTCSVSCGEGIKERTRGQIPAQHGGKPCVGDSVETTPCSNGPCPKCPDEQNLCNGECIPDKDKDCIPDEQDNCPEVYNVDQADEDKDGVGDFCDNCVYAANPDQKNTDGDETGDKCDPDRDNDSRLNQYDNCPVVWNVAQGDEDGDGWGDACDTCPKKENHNQEDSDGDGVGNACDSQPTVKNDKDGDGVYDGFDNCKDIENLGQEDKDQDHVGDVCDNCPSTFNPNQKDSDKDGFGDACDNCLYKANGDQADSDNDCIGDVCDYGGFTDKDSDGVADGCDNCPDVHNQDQMDRDGDGWGDVCDSCENVFLPGSYDKGCQAGSNFVESANLSTEDKKYLVAEIMEKLLEMFNSN